MSKLREQVDGTPEASRSSMEPQEHQAMLKYNYLTRDLEQGLGWQEVVLE